MLAIVSEALKASTLAAMIGAACLLTPADEAGTYSATHMDAAGNVYVDDSGLSYEDCLLYFADGFTCIRD